MVGTSGAPPLIVPDLAMDAPTFADALSRTLTEGDARTLRKFLAVAKNSYLQGKNEEHRSTALNRIAAVAVEALVVGDMPAVNLAMDVLFDLYGKLSACSGKNAR